MRKIKNIEPKRFKQKQKTKKDKLLASINKTSEKIKKIKNPKERQKLEEITKEIKQDSIDLNFINEKKQ